jgi:hypothetical protein
LDRRADEDFEGPSKELLRQWERELLALEDERVAELQRQADRLSFLIVATDFPEVDILIARRKLRERCQELFPDRLDLYDMIYESRFDRLWEQFRESSPR